MSTKPPSSVRGNNGVPEERGLRPGLKWAVAVLAVICLAALGWHFLGASPGTQGPTAPTETDTLAGPTAAASPSEPGNPNVAHSPDAPVRPAGAPPAVAPALPQGPVDPITGALIAGLNRLSGTNVALTAEAIGAWRTNFLDLVQAGSSAIPALRAFLEQKGDSAFSREAWQALGYGSPRLAALDALRQIGGPEATAAMEGLLGTTQSPKEIAVLARNLEDASPGQYRQQALEAARAALVAAGTSRNPELDVAPLFEVFSHYGDASVISELESAMSKWKYYATIALANLPEGAGIPTILRLADPSTGSGNRVVALEMMSQLAADNPTAREALLNQVRANQIPANLWPYLSGPLAGDQYFPVDSAITLYPTLQAWSDLRTTHLTYGNQNLYMLPGNQTLTADGINQRLALVDELLKATTDPAAQQTLQQARNTLAQRSGRLAHPPAGTGK